MKEGFDSYATPTGRTEKAPLTGDERIMSALEHSLSGEAKALFGSVATATTQEEFLTAIHTFNAHPREERGFGTYDHDRPLTQNIDYTKNASTPKGYPYTITLHQDGDVTLESDITLS